MIPFHFTNGKFQIKSIKEVNGNIHQRINQRAYIVNLRNFLKKCENSKA